jgi:hypothetical protein
MPPFLAPYFAKVIPAVGYYHPIRPSRIHSFHLCRDLFCLGLCHRPKRDNGMADSIRQRHSLSWRDRISYNINSHLHHLYFSTVNSNAAQSRRYYYTGAFVSFTPPPFFFSHNYYNCAKCSPEPGL